MSAEVYEIGAFRLVREKARPLGDQVVEDMMRRVREEQRQGRSGNGALGHLMDMRRQWRQGSPSGPEAA